MKSNVLLAIAIICSLVIATSALKCYTGIQQTGTGTITKIVEVGSNSTSIEIVCARYEQTVAFVTQKVFSYTDKTSCENWQKVTTFQKVYCCNTDLCNGSEAIIGSSLMILGVLVSSFILL